MYLKFLNRLDVSFHHDKYIQVFVEPKFHRMHLFMHVGTPFPLPVGAGKCEDLLKTTSTPLWHS